MRRTKRLPEFINIYPIGIGRTRIKISHISEIGNIGDNCYKLVMVSGSTYMLTQRHVNKILRLMV
ncbi:MAG: hypothetical protein A2V66_16770 [Ignavibacteria bacterium RBG_13_36_8]|nr:MAG: hypothetical protein A2V66_16770 [Ignavibacteria bacterium RBG_13_36_8]